MLDAQKTILLKPKKLSVCFFSKVANINASNPYKPATAQTCVQTAFEATLLLPWMFKSKLNQVDIYTFHNIRHSYKYHI